MYRFEEEQLVKAEIDQVWRFFANPANLAEITPPEMGMKVVDELPDKMYRGMMIRYRVKALAGIELPWTARITDIEEGSYFIDEQVEGPFSYWHHQHIFEAHQDGTLLRDILHYRVPGGPFAKLLEPLLVRKKLKDIFAFRRKKAEQLFGQHATQP